MRSLRWGGALLLLLGGILTMRSVPRVLEEYGARPRAANPSDDAAAIVARYGPPDGDTTTRSAPDTAQTRTLTYGDMQIVFAERTFATARAWKLVGFLDVRTRIALSGDDALKRLAARADRR